MEVYQILVLFSSTIFFCLLTSVAVDTISASQAIKDGNTIVSEGEMFELGFFSPGKSKNRYLGKWYKKILVQTVVWVANRETPITDASGMFKVSREGNLMILSGGNNTLIWSSNSTISVRNANPVVQLLDTGNLVVWDISSMERSLIWQSFDYPGDTLLPGMKYGKDLVTGSDRTLTSWKSPDDPSPGPYVHWVDTNGYPQMFARKGEAVHSRLGTWNGLGFSGLPIDMPNPIYSMDFVVNHKEIYHTYKLKSSVVQRVHLTCKGRSRQMHWIEKIQKWVVYANLLVDTCGLYAVCGSYAYCSIRKRPVCSCMEGFEPRVPDEWKASDWSSGCQRKTSLNCSTGDGFLKISGVKLPDTRKSGYNLSMTLEECEIACRRDCSCTAYANLDIRNGGSGCLLWFDELMDIRDYGEDQHLYVRLASADLPGNTAVSQSSFNEKEGLITVALLTFSAMLLLTVVYACIKKNRRHQGKGRGNWYDLDKSNTSVQIEDLDGLLFFSINEIAKATDNFSINNKIGEGGFDPVYKGVLEDRREVAVKRLSETSQQGLDEIKNVLVILVSPIILV